MMAPGSCSGFEKEVGWLYVEWIGGKKGVLALDEKKRGGEEGSVVAAIACSVSCTYHFLETRQGSLYREGGSRVDGGDFAARWSQDSLRRPIILLSGMKGGGVLSNSMAGKEKTKR